MGNGIPVFPVGVGGELPGLRDPMGTCREVSMQLETSMRSQKSNWKKWAIL